MTTCHNMYSRKAHRTCDITTYPTFRIDNEALSDPGNVTWSQASVCLNSDAVNGIGLTRNIIHECVAAKNMLIYGVISLHSG